MSNDALLLIIFILGQLCNKDIKPLSGSDDHINLFFILGGFPIKLLVLIPFPIIFIESLSMLYFFDHMSVCQFVKHTVASTSLTNSSALVSSNPLYHAWWCVLCAQNTFFAEV